MALNIRYVAADAAGGNDGTSEANAWTLAEMQTSASQNTLVYIKAGDYSSALTSYFDFPNIGIFSQPVVYEGYTTTPGDGGIASLVSSHTSGTFACFRFGTPRAVYRNLRFVGSRTSFSCFDVISSGVHAAFDNCIFERTAVDTYNGDLVNAIYAALFLRCLFIDRGTSTNWATYQHWAITGLNGLMVGCRVIAAGGGIESGSGGVPIRCIIEGLSGSGEVGIEVNNSGNRAIGCTIRNFSVGIQLTSATSAASYMSVFLDNIIYGCTTAFDSTVTPGNTTELLAIHNALGDYTTAYDVDLAPVALLFDEDITLTGDPFTDGANGDVSLNETAGAGAACRNTSAMDYYWDGDVAAPVRDLQSFADVGAIEASVIADYPDVKDVRYGVPFDSGGSTGTLTVPLASRVLSGIQYDDHSFDAADHQPSDADPAEQTGTLDLPAESDVREGTEYALAANTGTLDLPAESDVESGVAYDGETKTGSLDLPDESDVRDGVDYAATSKTGSLDLPAEADVRDGVTFDNTTKIGSLDLPAEADVKSGVDYDGETKTGTYDLSRAVTLEDLSE